MAAANRRRNRGLASGGAADGSTAVPPVRARGIRRSGHAAPEEDRGGAAGGRLGRCGVRRLGAGLPRARGLGRLARGAAARPARGPDAGPGRAAGRPRPAGVHPADRRLHALGRLGFAGGDGEGQARRPRRLARQDPGAVRRGPGGPDGRVGHGERLRRRPGRLRRGPLPGHPGRGRPAARLGGGPAPGRPAHRRHRRRAPPAASRLLGRGDGPDPVRAHRLPQPRGGHGRGRQGRHLGLRARRPRIGGEPAGPGRLEARRGLGARGPAAARVRFHQGRGPAAAAAVVGRGRRQARRRPGLEPGRGRPSRACC